MKILLIFSIIAFCFFVGKINKKNKKNSFYIAIAIIFSPVIIFNKINTQTFIVFLFFLLLLFVFDFTKNKLLKKILFLITLIYLSLAILYLSGIINNRLGIDLQKLFIIDNSSFETIRRFKLNALYLPKFLRPIIYNYLQIIFIFFVRALSYIWIDKLITYLGFAFIYLIYLTITQKKNKIYLFFPIIIVLSGILHRDPNSQLIFLFSIPAFLLFFIKNINKLNTSILFTAILISCLYSFL